MFSVCIIYMWVKLVELLELFISSSMKTSNAFVVLKKNIVYSNIHEKLVTLHSSDCAQPGSVNLIIYFGFFEAEECFSTKYNS